MPESSRGYQRAGKQEGADRGGSVGRQEAAAIPRTAPPPHFPGHVNWNGTRAVSKHGFRQHSNY